MNRAHSRNRGFTLIELMIVVAIIGILAAIAYPSYMDSVRQGRRSDGIAALSTVQIAQEKFRASCRFYAGGLANADACGANAGASTVNAAATSPDGHYTIAISNASATGYTATATGQGDQANDAEGGTTCTLVVTVSAANPSGAFTPAECWSRQ